MKLQNKDRKSTMVRKKLENLIAENAKNIFGMHHHKPITPQDALSPFEKFDKIF